MHKNISFLGSPLSHEKEALPLQRQLIQRLKQAILSGQLLAGVRLPSSRALAEELKVSRNTVLIVYDQLMAEGFIVADKKGTCVAALSTPLTNSKLLGCDRKAFSYAKRIERIVQAWSTDDKALPMTVGVPALSLFPLKTWLATQDRVLHAPLSGLLGYGDPLGEPALREAIAHYLQVSRGVRCDASRIVITEGAQGALSLCVSLFTNPGDTVWVEDPGYRGAISAFHAGDLNLIPMRVDHQGIVIPKAAWLTHPPRLIQTTPSHQYPTGSVLSVARRLDLIEQASRVGAWILEDDYDSEFRHQGEPIAAMQGLLPDAPVLYVGTFSKTMFPALRLGFLVLPESMATTVMPFVRELLRGGHRLEQLTMAAFIESGQFSRHLGRMRRLYRERQSALREALAEQFGIDHEVLGGNSGLHLTVRLPGKWPDREMVKEARRMGMNPRALSMFAMNPQPEDNGLVIGYGNTAAERFAPLVKQLGYIAARF